MNTYHEAAFDIFLAKTTTQNKKGIFQIISREAAPLCGLPIERLMDHLMDPDLHENSNLAPGVMVFDMRSEEIAEGVGILMTLDKPVELRGNRVIPYDIVAGIFSPFASGSEHLQKLASVSRLLRDEKLCTALRGAESGDALHVLFTTQDAIIKAA